MSARILIADDYSVHRRMIQHMLEIGGYDQIALAGDGMEALRLIESTEFDLIILDVDLPKMDGIHVLAHLRASTQYRNLPVVLLTARGDEQIRAKATQMGASTFLTKPASTNEVLQALRTLLG